MMALQTSNLLTMRQVMTMTGFKSRTTVYRRLASKNLPQPVSVGLGRLRWRERDIAEWVDNLELHQ
jgi:prophage regulatory protein